MSSTNGSSPEQDPNEYNQRRRLKAIHDAREAVREARERVDDGLYSGTIDTRTANTVLRRAVEEYIYEVEHVMKEWIEENTEQDENGEETLTVTDYWAEHPLGQQELPGGEILKFVGLESVLDTADPITIQFEVEPDDQLGAGTETRVDHVQINRDVLLAAYRAINGWLCEVGFDLERKTEVPETKITREMIEDVEEWRKQNIPQ